MSFVVGMFELYRTSGFAGGLRGAGRLLQKGGLYLRVESEESAPELSNIETQAMPKKSILQKPVKNSSPLT